MSAIQTGGSVALGRRESTREDVERLLANGEFFWLDLDAPHKQDFELLRNVFGFHPLAVEDSEHFGQRPKLEDYGDRQLQEIFRMKRLLVTLRKAVSPQRDTFASLAGSAVQLPGMNREEERYFRDVYDHLLRISELIDNVRDLLTSSLDVYLSTVSNRLNSVMKQLVIATIFLPLSWLTGFFGQNFGWLAGHIGAWETFVAIGLGTQLLMLAALLLFFRRRAWF